MGTIPVEALKSGLTGSLYERYKESKAAGKKVKNKILNLFFQIIEIASTKSISFSSSDFFSLTISKS